MHTKYIEVQLWYITVTNVHQSLYVNLEGLLPKQLLPEQDSKYQYLNTNKGTPVGYS